MDNPESQSDKEKESLVERFREKLNEYERNSYEKLKSLANSAKKIDPEDSSTLLAHIKKSLGLSNNLKENRIKLEMQLREIQVIQGVFDALLRETEKAFFQEC